MRLKRLDLTGYKTFATQTEFVFDGGITAIIGPNGSGKSNVADAIRWVLGEQSFSLLRAKRGEDMIFAGSEKRARMGMAEATITLDNQDSWLPIDFSEVTITRRAHRSGENDYLLNGSRVRLRDISDLLGKSGLSKRTYTVIGQGLIDRALSLRPQERRALLEEAAGVSLYQSRRTDALSKLDETKRNVLRVHDLLTEITPRLKRLARQAERAQEYEQIHQELAKASRIWYSYQWKSGRDELERVREVLDHLDKRQNVQQGQLEELDAQIVRARSEQTELRRQLSEWHRESSALHRHSETLQRKLAVADERRRLLIQQEEQTQSEIVSLETERLGQASRLEAIDQKLTAETELLNEQKAQVDAARQALEAHRRRVEALFQTQSRVQNQLSEQRTSEAGQRSRLNQIKERIETLVKERLDHELSCRNTQQKIETHRTLWSEAEKQRTALAEKADRLHTEQERVQAAITDTRAQQQAVQSQVNKVEQKLGRLRERHEVLTRMRQEGAGLYDGVRTVRQAADKLSLTGIVGTVAELIHVPQELERAFEVALGSHLQDVVVRTWDNAQAAVEHLKRSKGGRATFLPLDTLRPGQPVEMPQTNGVLGVGSDLVQADKEIDPVVRHLLGRTLICKDLDSARRALGKPRGGYQLVTVDGEIVRSSGAVTGGTRRGHRQSLLGREREWRDLPDTIMEVEKARQALLDTLNQAVQAQETLERQAVECREQQQMLAKQQRSQTADTDRLAQQLAQAKQTLIWQQGRVRDVMDETERLHEQQTAVTATLTKIESKIEVVQAQLAELRLQIAEQDDTAEQEMMAEWQALVVQTQQRAAGLQAERREVQQNVSQVARRILVRQNRQHDLSASLAETEQNLGQVRSQEETLRAEIQQYTTQISPAEIRLDELEKQQIELEKRERQTRTRFQDLESRHSHADLQVSRQEEHMKNLRRQIQDELGLVDLEMGDALSGQPVLPMQSLVSSLPEITILPDGLETQMTALRRRMRMLGSINPDAPQEHAQMAERHAFLTEQAEDLEQAIMHLRQVIVELDQVIEREFKHTFRAVADQFKQYFGRLFNGGSARLELSEPDNVMESGIDIVARPPGKRQQGLALLSGGERALTAAALIFAILSVSPTPFCVLDEVDAALDEANVGRFRALLKSLSEQTQFVIITHNRYTIEMADIVYGVSMQADGISCVISRRMSTETLPDAAAAS